jgi:hypothetical protein
MRYVLKCSKIPFSQICKINVYGLFLRCILNVTRKQCEDFLNVIPLPEL